jgi:hypothetical protein
MPYSGGAKGYTDYPNAVNKEFENRFNKNPK